MQLESAVEVGEVVETRKSRNFNDRAVGCQQQHSRSIESQVVDVADKGRIHQLLEEMRYVVAADSCRVGDIVERQAVDIVLVNVGSNALESTVLFAFALGIDDLDESVGKQLIKRLVHLAVNKELEKLGLFGFRLRSGLDAVEKLRMSSLAGRDARVVGAVAVHQSLDNALREVILSYRRGIGEVDGNDINVDVVAVCQLIPCVGRYKIDVALMEVKPSVGSLKSDRTVFNVAEQSFVMSNAFVI